MRIKIRQHERRAFVLLVALLLVAPILASSQVMESANYRIQFDSLNTGGVRSSSANYNLEDTVGEIATGESSSASYKLKAGYQQMNEVFLSLTAAADVTLSPSIGGVTGGTANGSTVTTVTTDGSAGYELTIKASTTPAMERDGGPESIADYTPAGANPDFTFSVAASDSELAYTPEGTDIAARFQDNGSDCNMGSSDAADSCWDALDTATEVIARRTSANHPSGTATTIKFRVEVGSSVTQIEGTYTATTTLTLTAL